MGPMGLSQHALPTIAAALAAAAAGLLFGGVYFRALRIGVAAMAAQGGWRRLLLLTLARLGIAVLLFAMAARLGALPLLSAFAGFLLARRRALRGGREAV